MWIGPMKTKMDLKFWENLLLDSKFMHLLFSIKIQVLEICFFFYNIHFSSQFTFDMCLKPIQGTIVNKLQNGVSYFGRWTELTCRGFKRNVQPWKTMNSLSLQHKPKTRLGHPLNYSNVGFSWPNLNDQGTLDWYKNKFQCPNYFLLNARGWFEGKSILTPILVSPIQNTKNVVNFTSLFVFSFVD